MGSTSTDSNRAAGGAARPVVIAGVALGLGFGGFFDGIVFHQLLQWHHMLSHHSNPAIAGNLRLNVFADGLFHVLAYLATACGLALLVRAARRPDAVVTWRLLGGALIAGWGVFNLLEGLINHQLLGIHHVNPAGPGSTLLWDLAFLAWGAAFLLGSALIVSRSPAAGTASSGRPTPE